MNTCTPTKETYSVAHDLKDQLSFDPSEIKETLENMRDEETDFEVSDHRFIHKNQIDEIMKEELLSDKYVLGACTPWFVSDITGLDINQVEKAQKNDSYELLGELMANKIDDVVEGIISNDGYGHHFGHYDGNEYEVGDYYAFRVN